MATNTARTGYVLDIKLSDTDPNLRALYAARAAEHNARVESGQPHLDAGFDLFVPADAACTWSHADADRYGVQYTIDHGVACRMERVGADGATTPSAFYMHPRSSISKTPFMLSNSAGVIDSGYRGNLISKLNVRPMNPGEEYVVEPYSRLCQICTPDLTPLLRVRIVDELDRTARGAGGFGSTGA
jgi:dUTPase